MLSDVKTTFYPMHLSVYLSNARAELKFCPIVLGLSHLENLNLSFTLVTDSGLRKLSGLTSLRSLNLDTRQITDSGLAVLTSKY